MPHWDSQDGVGDGVRLLSGAGSVLSLLPCYPASGNRASPQPPETLPLCRLSLRYFQHSHCQLQHSPPKTITERSVSHSTINSYCFSLKADCPPQLTWSLLLCESDNTKGKQAVLYQLHVCYTACSCPLPDTCNAQRKYLPAMHRNGGERRNWIPSGLWEVGAVMRGMCPVQPQPVQIREGSRTTLNRAQDLGEQRGTVLAVPCWADMDLILNQLIAVSRTTTSRVISPVLFMEIKFTYWERKQEKHQIRGGNAGALLNLPPLLSLGNGLA